MPSAAVPFCSPLAQLADLKSREQQLQQLLQELHSDCERALKERQQQLQLLKQQRSELRIKQEKARAREALAKARVKTQGSTTARQQLQRAKAQLEQLKSRLRTLRSDIQAKEIELAGYRDALRFHKQREKALQAHQQQWRQRYSDQPRRGRPPKSASEPESKEAQSKRRPRHQGSEIPLKRRRGRLPLAPRTNALEIPSIFDPLP